MVSVGHGVFGAGAGVVVQICNEGGRARAGIGGEVCHLEHGVLGSCVASGMFGRKIRSMCRLVKEENRVECDMAKVLEVLIWTMS